MSAIVDNAEVSISSVKSTAGMNSDASTASDQGFVAVVSKNKRTYACDSNYQLYTAIKKEQNYTDWGEGCIHAPLRH
jgi:hypothetical protein